MKHTSTVHRFQGSHRELAEDLGNLYYDTLADFLSMLAAKIEADGEKDRSRGRVKLATELHASAEAIKMASEHMAKVWEICAPFTPERKGSEDTDGDR